MSQYSWDTCPPHTRRQLDELVNSILSILGGNLIGGYLHGSLAMGCFNPERSDIDLLIITAQPMPVEANRNSFEPTASVGAGCTRHPLDSAVACSLGKCPGTSCKAVKSSVQVPNSSALLALYARSRASASNHLRAQLREDQTYGS